MRENAALFDLPAFDSLPAAAGLTNLESFQLSVRHALALLPALVTEDGAEENGGEEMERFQL